MKINQFSQMGKRSNNEDSLGYSMGLLTVCDGMGGHNYGERASAYVKEAMLKTFAVPQPIGKMEIQQQLNQIQTDINQIIEAEPDFDKMGTTFTGVFITPDVWYAAHIGDSRIYLFRPSEQKLWHTWDHSAVGEMMRTKQITVEEGRNHPQANRISRAIMAHKDTKPSSASIVKIDQLKVGDIIMLCSDGVIESWSDLELVKLFSDESLTFDQKCKRLSDVCEVNSSDNNTAIIAEIEGEDAIDFGNNDELDWTTFAEVQADYDRFINESNKLEEKSDDNSQVATNPNKSKDVQKKQSFPPKKMKKTNAKTGSKVTGVDNIVSKWPYLLAILVVVGLVVFFLTRKPAPKPEDVEFQNCTEVNDYRAYMSHYGAKGKHYAEAKQFVDNYVADSIQKAKDEGIKVKKQKEQEPKAQEDAAYQNCTTIEACDKYLKNYPKGRYVNEVKQKKAELEKKNKSKKQINTIKNDLENNPINLY